MKKLFRKYIFIEDNTCKKDYCCERQVEVDSPNSFLGFIAADHISEGTLSVYHAKMFICFFYEKLETFWENVSYTNKKKKIQFMISEWDAVGVF